MFFYRLKVTVNRGSGRSTTTTDYFEALKAEYVGEKVAATLVNLSGVTRIAVEPISQAKYVRATRPGE